MRWLRAAGEGALLGCAAGAVLGGWEVKLHRDLVHGTWWLAVLRTLPMLAAGVIAGLVLAVGIAGLREALRRRRAAIDGTPGVMTDGLWRRTAAAGVGVIGLALAPLAAAPLRAQAAVLAPWSSSRLEAAALGGVLLAAAALVVLRLWPERLPGPLAQRLHGPRVMVAAAGLAVGALALGAPALAPLAGGWLAAGRPSVVLVSIDTWRADRLGALGSPRPTTPNLDVLAAEGMLFEQALSPAPWTLPAHVSLFTSRLPYDHRVQRVGARIRPDRLLLSELFRNAGYRTAAFTGGGYVSVGYGFQQGFEVYEDHDEAREGGPEAIAAAARRWVQGVGDRPFFLFVHTYEPHGPYTDTDFVDPDDVGRLTPEIIAGKGRYPPDPTAAERRYLTALYDGDVAHADRVIGGLLHELRADGVLDRAVLVVTSDHGEDLWDHDARDIPRHGHTLYQEMLHVPLFFRAPGSVAAGRIATPVSLLDVAPTLLSLTGLPAHPLHDGSDLAAELGSATEPPTRRLLAESVRYGPERFAVREGDLKVIHMPDPERVLEASPVRLPPPVEIFDLGLDPRETVNLAGNGVSAPPPPLPGARELLDRVLGRAVATRRRTPGEEPASPAVDEALRQQLRSLGYAD